MKTHKVASLSCTTVILLGLSAAAHADGKSVPLPPIPSSTYYSPKPGETCPVGDPICVERAPVASKPAKPLSGQPTPSPRESITAKKPGAGISGSQAASAPVTIPAPAAPAVVEQTDPRANRTAAAPGARPVAKEAKTADGYSYSFDDDSMSGNGMRAEDRITGQSARPRQQCSKNAEQEAIVRFGQDIIRKNPALVAFFRERLRQQGVGSLAQMRLDAEIRARAYGQPYAEPDAKSGESVLEKRARAEAAVWYGNDFVRKNPAQIAAIKKEMQKSCCFDSWMEKMHASVLEHKVPDLGGLKDGYNAFLQCMDPCMSPRDRNWVVNECVDWRQELRILTGEASPGEVLPLLDGSARDPLSCAPERFAQAVAERKIENRHMGADGRCVNEPANLDARWLTVALGTGLAATRESDATYRSSPIGTLQVRGFFARRNDNVYYDADATLGFDYTINAPKRDTRATLVGYNFGGNFSADGSIYRTFLDKGYTCTPMVGARLTAEAGVNGGMSTTRVADAAAQLSAGGVCSDKKTGKYALKLTANLDVLRGSVFALYPGAVDPLGLNEDYRLALARVGQGGSIELKGITPGVLGTAEVGMARYSDAIRSREQYAKATFGFRPWKSIFMGPSIQASQYSATVPGTGGQAERQIKERDFRSLFIVGGELPF